MKINNTTRNILLAGAAAALVAVLTFFYNKTQTVDLRERNEIRDLLRELKDIDTRWDAGVLRARFEMSADTMPVPDRGADAAKALQKLGTAARDIHSVVLAAVLPELEKAVTQKSDLMQKFQAANQGAKEALQIVLKSAPAINAQLGGLRKRSLMLEQALRTLTTVAPQYYLFAEDTQKSLLEVAASQLQYAQVPDNLHDMTQQLDAAVQTLLKTKPDERALSAQLAVTTAGPRLDSTMFAFDREIETAIDEKERYRAYLVAYAGALLILIAWLGFKLKTAYEGLELRVQERTRELSEALKHLKESETQLIQSEKMAALGQMVAGVAHEINTPLAYVKNSLGAVAGKLPDINTIIVNCEKLLTLLQAGAGADSNQLSQQFATVSAQITQFQQQRVLAELGGLVDDGLYGTGQMTEIVGNLKDFSRLDRSKVTSFNLNEGLNSTLLLAKHLLKSITVNKQFGDIPAITCSPSQMNQVFLNLVTNAAQAMESGKGTITLTTRRDGDGIAVEVADSGKGIPPDVLPKIFDPFFTTKEAGKGTGLGLSISYKIVQQHGGHINVTSQPGSGTKFTVWLPLQPPTEAVLD
jgi:signal transduction histidine kinase